MTMMRLYEKDEEVQYLCIDLLWGQGLYQKLRFVLTVIDGTKSILVSTDLTMEPLRIIYLYCHRFKIEVSFRELKQVIAGFGYRFWSKRLPKLNKYRKNEETQELLEKLIIKQQHRNSIKSCVKAINGYVQISCIALGMLQLMGLIFSGE